MIKGRSFIIKLGTNKVVKTNGFKIVTFKFLKNSISSNRFKITPNEKIINITRKNVLKKFVKIYFKIILFIFHSVLNLYIRYGYNNDIKINGDNTYIYLKKLFKPVYLITNSVIIRVKKLNKNITILFKNFF